MVSWFEEALIVTHQVHDSKEKITQIIEAIFSNGSSLLVHSNLIINNFFVQFSSSMLEDEGFNEPFTEEAGFFGFFSDIIPLTF